MAYTFSPNVAQALRGCDARIVITGAGGWLGLATLELLSDALGDELQSRVRCFGSSDRELTLLTGARIQQHRLDRLGALDPRPTLVLHLAFLTKDRAENMAEAAYRQANRGLSQLVFDNLDKIGAEGVFVASSGAARFADDPSRSSAMRLYGEMKRADEELFASWADAAGRRAVIARIFNIAGPHINKQQSYALSAFILDAIAKRPITVLAPHRVTRGYVAIRELMSLVFALLLKDGSGVTYFDTGGEPMELGEVAQAVAAELGGEAVRAPPDHGPEDIYVGDGSTYERLLADYEVETVPFRQQIRETSDFIGAGAKKPEGA
jgi:nucleoside-diphosphate-sugar epimerase